MRLIKSKHLVLEGGERGDALSRLLTHKRFEGVSIVLLELRPEASRLVDDECLPLFFVAFDAVVGGHVSKRFVGVDDEESLRRLVEHYRPLAHRG